eukprot:TRINITY_DN14096_c1_g2_i1.p1 TRINITY_DN14096_c1_g2~~TRINITY_DN14096_c1_g2_i1.p1  ORF type:complete len:232 (-),score=25.48 TRINITY_DN14096_c1_g2_i1:521-1216(-)
MSPPNAALVGLGAFASAVLFWYKFIRSERPKYKVIKKIKGKTTGGATVQIRVYAPYIVAEVLVDGAMKQAMGKGFDAVADYILGGNMKAGSIEEDQVTFEEDDTASVMSEMTNNHKKQRIAKTATLRTSMLGRQQYKVSFIMPAKYTMEKLPTPTNPNVKLFQVPGHTMAALRFKGPPPSPNRVERKRQLLKQILSENKITIVGDLMLYQYQPPFWPPPMRQNEVLFQIDY